MLVGLVVASGVAVTTGVAAGTPVGTAPDDGSVHIAAVYPNPYTHQDRGEYVALATDGPTSLDGWSLADDSTAVRLPNVTVDGRAVFSPAPALTRNRTEDPVHELPAGLALANTGDRVTLRRGDAVVDSVSYEDAPEGEVGRPTGDGVGWQRLGATDFEVVEAAGGSVEAFVLPDSGDRPTETVASADDRILLAGYTLTSDRLVDELLAARRRGVDVRVLVDDSPVGGMTRREAAALDRLAAADVAVTVQGGRDDRYAFHHAKYAVVDDRAVVTTENWKPAGTGGRASRGWGAIVAEEAVVGALVDTFEADASWRDATAWSAFRKGRRFEPAEQPPADGNYPTRFEPRTVRPERIGVLRAPDNAERRVVELLDGAEESIRVQQVAIGNRNQPFLRATLRAARRGVEVRILLSGAWYVEEDNRELVAWLEDVAAQEDLPLSARVADPNGRFEKIHAKGVVVDDERVLLGSLNWNNNSARANREVVLLLEGEAVGEYFTAVFDADWQGGRWRLPAGLVVAVAVCWLAVALLARRIRFETGASGLDGRW